MSQSLKHLRILLFATSLAGVLSGRSQSLPEFDFSKPPQALEWSSPHDLQILPPSNEGLPLKITGEDPYFSGPPRNYPAGQRLWANIRLKSDLSGKAQLFYYKGGASEENSIHFPVPAGEWSDVKVPLPALGSGTRLRLDPPGNSGICILSRITFELRPVLTEPVWPRPQFPVFSKNAKTIKSGDLSLRHAPILGGFEIRVRNHNMAAGNTQSVLGYVKGTNTQWLSLAANATAESIGSGIRVRSSVSDPNGARWNFEQIFTPSAKPNGIDFESRVSVDQDRSVIFLPLLTLLPGFNSFGTNKSQALLAGVEYLENEPSSSEADLMGPGSHRQVPDGSKLTFPLMALAAESNYVAVMWEINPDIAALHDSPDRIFHSGGHLMSLNFPGSSLSTREDGALLPYGGQTLQANKALVLHGTILGGLGQTIVPAVQQYIARQGLPPIPATGYSARDYFALAAYGWLDSDIRDGAKFRHAVGSNFGSAPVADAAMYMDWLAAKMSNSQLQNKLTTVARDTRALISPNQYNSAAIGHIRFPAEALIFGSVPENATTACDQARGQLNAFQASGSINYQPPAKGINLSRTSPSREADGLTATHVSALLERAAFCGDQALIHEGIRLLRAMNKFHNTIPRGAQTWEVPLHTPDILASAYLVRAYTLGFELTGDSAFLEEARYWAWTGVPFIYLDAPTPKPVGLYATTPVFGATQFVAPNWIGLPVQWCGLVYGNAIRRFARFDPEGPWLQLANGIAASGLQQTHTAAEPHYQGLLPDSFDLAAQLRNQVPINPGTLLPEAIQMFGEDPLYDFHAFRKNGLLVHAPGPIREASENNSTVKFRVTSWPRHPWYLLINGFKNRPEVFVNDARISLETPHQFEEKEGRLILQLRQPSHIEIRN